MVLFDSHVHIYDCFNLDIFFAKAFQNFSTAAGAAGGERENLVCFLLLTESDGYNYFSKLCALAESSPEGGETASWKISRTGEEHSLCVTHGSYPSILFYVVAGRQLITAERLELLALFTDGEFAEGEGLSETLAAVASRGGLPVCPWGAGKWLGERGRKVSKYFREERDDVFFAGDSGGRPLFWPAPALFELARKNNRHILSGTDPLPLAGEEGRVGSFGSRLAGESRIDPHFPAGSLKESILQSETEVEQYGRLQGPVRFIWNQFNLRFNKGK